VIRTKINKKMLTKYFSFVNKKGLLLTSVTSIFILTASVAIASMTFDTDTITGSGEINLNPTGQPVTINGDLTITGSCTGCGSGGAPTDAAYWTSSANGGLSAEVNLGALSTGLLLNTAGTPSAYAGTSCTNQFVRSLNASGAATCASVAAETDISGVLPVANGGSRVGQVVNTQTGAYSTGTTTIPLDDTIPQNTEGTEFMTLSITPSSATNKLRIDVIGFLSTSSGEWLSMALFQDSTANALAAVSAYQPTATGMSTVPLTHFMTAGTTSPITFKVRAGPNAGGTIGINGSGGRKFGGVAASSITITEIVP
jgi:hypothetical protein